MRPDDLEFLIAQYADGSLDAKRSAELEAVLRRDDDARAMLESYRAVDGALADIVARQPVPEVQWGKLESAISRRVASLATAAPMSEESEEAISRLSSGDGLELELRAIDAKIASDPSSRLLLAEYASLDRVFDGVRATPTPDVKWDRFAMHISSQIDRAEDASAESLRIRPEPSRRREDESEGILGRIGAFFAQPRRLALAACVLLAATISFKLINQGDPAGVGPIVAPTPGGPTGGPIVTVTPPAIDIRVGPSYTPGAPIDHSTVTSIQVGPPTGGSFDLTAIADYAREAYQASIGKAATQPDTRSVRDEDMPFAPR